MIIDKLCLPIDIAWQVFTSMNQMCIDYDHHVIINIHIAIKLFHPDLSEIFLTVTFNPIQPINRLQLVTSRYI